ncbi:MAG: phospholipase D family protein [Planctomycetota bacterium]
MHVRATDLDSLDPAATPAAPRGTCELIADTQHLDRVVRRGMLDARVSLDVMTADFKAMLVPPPIRTSGRRDAPSIVAHLLQLARRGVEIRILHAGVPSGAALRELKKASPLPDTLTIRRCPRLHAKAVIVDASAMYLGSANLTGAGLGAKAARNRNFELGVWTEAPELIEPVSASFNELWEAERCRDCGRRDVCPVPLEEPRLR